MYNNILYPVDIFEEGSWDASLPMVKEYVQAFDATLHVMTVVPDYGMSLVSQYLPKDTKDRVLAKVKDKLHKFVEDNLEKQGIKLGNNVITKGGSVYQSIIDTAENIKADLIIVSAHRPDLKDYLLGPNAAKVVRHSKTSVLVVRY